MASSIPAKEFAFVVCAAVGFSWKAPRNGDFSTTIGQKIFAYGEKISPANEKQNSLSFWLRRPISNQLINAAHLTEVASLATEAIGQEIKGVWNRYLGTPDIHPETEKKLEEMQQNWQQKLALIKDCKKVVTHFGVVVEGLQTANTAREQVYNTISPDLAPDVSIDIPQNLLSSLQVLTKELRSVAGEQPENLRIYVELAVRFDEEQQSNTQASEKLKKLQAELPEVVRKGIESKESLELGVKNLTPLVKAATPERPSKVPSEMRSGRNPLGPVQRALFIIQADTTV